MLSFNCALMLVLMLRKHITWLRSKGGGILLPLDNHIDIHKTIGIIILIETVLHVAAHLAYLGWCDFVVILLFIIIIFFLAYVFYICALPEDVGVSCQSDRNLNQSLNSQMSINKTLSV